MVAPGAPVGLFSLAIAAATASVAAFVASCIAVAGAGGFEAVLVDAVFPVLELRGPLFVGTGAFGVAMGIAGTAGKIRPLLGPVGGALVVFDAAALGARPVMNGGPTAEPGGSRASCTDGLEAMGGVGAAGRLGGVGVGALLIGLSGILSSTGSSEVGVCA